MPPRGLAILVPFVEKVLGHHPVTSLPSLHILSLGTSCMAPSTLSKNGLSTQIEANLAKYHFLGYDFDI